MQRSLRHEVVRAIFHAEPVAAEDLDRPIETELSLELHVTQLVMLAKY